VKLSYALLHCLADSPGASAKLPPNIPELIKGNEIL